MSEFVLEILLYILIYALAYPVTAVLTTPVILIIALWGPKSYLSNVRHYYGRVFRWLAGALEKAG